jgi:hypothetical protein
MPRTATAGSLEEVIREFRKILPEDCATARAIDGLEPWEQVAQRAVDDGYIDFVNEFSTFIEVCVRHNS